MVSAPRLRVQSVATITPARAIGRGTRDVSTTPTLLTKSPGATSRFTCGTRARATPTGALSNTLLAQTTFMAWTSLAETALIIQTQHPPVMETVGRAPIWWTAVMRRKPAAKEGPKFRRVRAGGSHVALV